MNTLKRAHKFVSLLSSMVMVLQPLAPAFQTFTPTVFAQEATPDATVTATPTDTVAPTPTDTIAPTPTPDATPTDTLIPTETVTPTPDATPTDTVTPTATETPIITTTEPPHETSPPEHGDILPEAASTEAPASPTPTVVPQPVENGHLETSVVTHTNADTLDLGSVDPSSATLTTDKADYAPTDTAIISGTGFLANHTYTLTISSNDPPATSTAVSITADANGSFVYAYQLDGNYRPNYKVEIANLGGHVIATTTFTDSISVSEYSQCANDTGTGYSSGGKSGCDWINGNLQKNNSAYYEGDATPQRLYLSDLSNGSHTVRIKYGTTKGGKHAYDFVTDDKFSETWITDADMCESLTGFNLCSTLTPNQSSLIPTDSNAAGLDVAQVNRHFKIRNGTISSVGTPTLASGSYAGDSETTILITFSVNTSTCVNVHDSKCPVLLTWGEHVSRQSDWGGGNSAVNISGSPYHVSLDQTDGGSAGSRDNQMQADAIKGSITLDKETNPQGNTTSFGFTTSGFSTNTSPSLTDAAIPVIWSNLDPGTFTISESTVPGWALTSKNCTGGVGSVVTQTSNGVSIALHQGENLTCTFTNTLQKANLTLVKTVTNNNGGTAAVTDWTLTATGPSTISGSSGSTAVTSATVDGGTYTLSESNGPSGYAAGSWSCVKNGGSPVSGSNITLAPNDTATCTINNDDTSPTLKLTKTVTNNNGGSAVPANWNLTATGSVGSFTDAGNSTTFHPVNSGVTYTLSESGPSSYTAGIWSCTSGTLNGNQITLALGQNVTCTINNDDTAAHLIVIKHVINDNGGTASASNFTMSITGVTATGGTSFAGAENPGTDKTLTSVGSYNVSETGPSGYAASYSPECTGTIALGETKTCTVTNDDIGPQLTVIKHVINDNGGSAAAGNFTMNVTGTNVSSGSFAGSETGTTVTLNAGPYSVDENVYAGYTKSLGTNCSGSIALGESKSCTITNDDNAPSLHLQKTITNNNGGNAAATDWTLTATGTLGSPTNLSGSTPVDSDATFKADTYTLAETGGPTGYTAGTWSCVKNNASPATGSSISLSPGDSATCTINNDDQPGTLIVKKIVINDNGGTASASAFTFKVNNGSAVAFEADRQNDLTVNAGTYTVTEPTAIGYATTYDNCSNVTVTNGGTATCTITNDDIQPKLTVTKVVTNTHGGTKVVSDFPLFVGGTPVTSGTQSAFNAGTYTVSETSQAGYTGVISGDCDARTGTITLAAGDVKSCTITNSDQPGTLIVKKIVVNDNGGTATASSFAFRVNSGTAQSFESDGQNDLTVDAGTYSVAESTASGYATTYDNCTDVTVTNGGTATCTITNDDIAPRLTVIKHVINDNGGEAVAGSFTMRVTGTNVSNSSFAGEETGTTVTLNAGAYSVSEDAVSGYGATYSDNCSGVMAVGQSKTCTVTNNDLYSNIIVTKFRDDNGNGVRDEGEVILPGWQMNLAHGEDTTLHQTTGADGAARFDYLLSGTYSLSETVQPGFELIGISCTETEQTSQTNGIRIKLGTETAVHCFVANKPLNPILTITKANNAAGDQGPGGNVTFTITVTATQSAAYDVHVTDLPSPGFTYRTGSATAVSSVRGTLPGALTHEYASPGIWSLGPMAVGETVTLTYITDISADQKPGTYKDLAMAYGCKTDAACTVGDDMSVISMAVNPGYVNDTYVGTAVTVVKEQQNGGTLNAHTGEVLGASTELPATGASDVWLMLAGLLFIAGLGLIGAGQYKRRIH